MDAADQTTSMDTRLDKVLDVAEQIHEEIGAIVTAVESLLGPTSGPLATQLQVRAETWAAQILSDDDDTAAQTVIDLMCVRWPDSTTPPHEWWGTPLGRAVAASTGYDGATVVSHSIAAAMLGCTRQRVGKLVEEKLLERGPDGHGVTTASIRARIRSRAGRPAVEREIT